jgi:transposase, IS5 family
MHQTRKGKQRYFGMKLHIGVDSKTGLAHSAGVRSADVHDKHPLPDLLHGGEKQLYRDSAYASQQALIHSKAPQAEDCTNQRVRAGSATEDLDRILNRLKSRVRLASRACVRGAQAAVGLRQGALPGPGEERHAGVRGYGPGQHLLGAPAPQGMSAPAWRATCARVPKCGPTQLGSTANLAMLAHDRTLLTAAQKSVACSVLP